MKRKLVGLGVLGFLCAATPAVRAQAQNFSDTEREAWSALEAQLGHIYAGEWDKNAEYLHPEIVLWGPYSPVPFPYSETSERLFQTEVSRSGKVLGFELTPVTVLVDGDVAIINFYVRELREVTPDGEVEWTGWRGHNTWKKDGERWRLLATYNTFDDEE